VQRGLFLSNLFFVPLRILGQKGRGLEWQGKNEGKLGKRGEQYQATIS